MSAGFIDMRLPWLARVVPLLPPLRLMIHRRRCHHHADDVHLANRHFDELENTLEPSGVEIRV